MPWYVLHSKPNKEELLYEQLCIRTIDAYYPRIKVHPVNPRARKRKPYFPGYLFVNTDLDVTGPSTFKWIPGAIGLIDFGSVPASVPDELLQMIRQRVDQVNAVSEKAVTKFKPGDIVMIHSGPFAGFQAIFDSCLPGRERVRVFLQMLWERQVSLDLSVGQISQKNNHHIR
jgi:transcriptional antiterminator RfaH